MKSSPARPVAKVWVVSYGSAKARIKQRADGRWVVRWREAGQSRSTTSMTAAGAEALAKKKVRELDGKIGGRVMTVADGELVERLRAVCGDRSAHAVLDELESWKRRMGGWESFGRALAFYEASGMASVTRVTVKKARDRFLDLYDKKRPESSAGPRKELDLFIKAYPTMEVADLTAEMLRPWIGRKKDDGEEIEARTANNRLAVWRTFLNRCREWGYWAKGEKHPAELIPKEKEADRIPAIFTVAQATKILQLLLDTESECLNYFVISCWLGLRPGELLKLKWEDWDWERGYVEVHAETATKTMQQRFVPIPDNVRHLLQGRQNKTWGKMQPRLATACTRTDDQPMLSRLLREAGLIDEWVPDVPRHSYISYRLAEGRNRGQVAEWSGNSEAIIRKRYRRPLRAEDGKAWFEIGLHVGVPSSIREDPGRVSKSGR